MAINSLNESLLQEGKISKSTPNWISLSFVKASLPFTRRAYCKTPNERHNTSSKPSLSLCNKDCRDFRSSAMIPSTIFVNCSMVSSSLTPIVR